MTSKSKIMIVVLGLAVAAVAGFAVSMPPQAKHLLSVAASAVWGS